MSERPWMVVEQLIWPPRKKATSPLALKSGAGGGGDVRIFKEKMGEKWEGGGRDGPT